MIGDGAAGPRVNDLLKGRAAQHGVPDLIEDFIADAGIGDENPAAVDGRRIAQPLRHILHQTAIQMAAVLFAHAHLSVTDLDAGLQA